MKRILQWICLLAVAALLPAALVVSRGLPADAHPYVEKKYAGWNGVLRAWVCARWSCGGGFTRWLNACAADFERGHDGVYIEFTPVDEAALGELGKNGIRPPEMVLFTPGVPVEAAQLAPAEAPAALRSELRDFGRGVAYPVAMGGYIWVYDRARSDGAPEAGEGLIALPDDGARSFSAATLALLSGENGESEGGEPLAEPGLDLGLPANAEADGSAPAFSVAGDALERFIAGELPALAVTQAELARLIRLRDAGRGPDWTCAAGRLAYTDQLLLLGFTAQSDADAAERLALAEEFGRALLSAEAQAKLAEVGAFGVTGERIYDGLSAYAALDGLLNGGELLTPADAWAKLPDCGAPLRALALGERKAPEAEALLRERLG